MNTNLPLAIDNIVSTCHMPREIAEGLLSSSILYATGQCKHAEYVASVAHLRLSLGEDWQDASAMLAGWLDSVNG